MLNRPNTATMIDGPGHTKMRAPKITTRSPNRVVDIHRRCTRITATGIHADSLSRPVHSRVVHRKTWDVTIVLRDNDPELRAALRYTGEPIGFLNPPNLAPDRWSIPTRSSPREARKPDARAEEPLSGAVKRPW
jgi:hypothetical protein